MPTRDRLLAISVAVLWGLNFLAIDIGLEHLPPFFFAGLRFLVMAVPVILFVPRPDVPWKYLIGYGLGFGTAQFAFLFLALHIGMPVGLSSLVLQSSAPFTVILGTLVLGETITRRQIIGIVISVVGLAAIGWDRAHTAALLPVLLTLAGGLGWAFGNLANRQARTTQPLAFTLWMSVVPPIPLLALSAVIEGPTTGWKAFGATFSSTGWPALAALAYVVIIGTVIGSGIWTTLMTRHPAGVVAPFSLLVPVVGIAASWIWLHEAPGVVSLLAGVLVVAGVLIGLPRRTAAAPADSVDVVG